MSLESKGEISNFLYTNYCCQAQIMLQNGFM